MPAVVQPSSGIPDQEPRQRLRWHPAGNPSHPRYRPQSLRSLLEFEVAHIFLHHVRHGHAQPRREVLYRHPPLFRGILQQFDKTIRQPFRAAGRKELNSKFFALCHLSEIQQIGTNDRNSIGASQVSHSTASGRR